MKIKNMRVKNFRAHRDTGVIPISLLTGFIGRNDSGKSSLLYALDAFLNSGRQIDPNNIYRRSELNQEEFTEIELTFDDIPTSIKDVSLVSFSGDLVLKKSYSQDGKLVRYKIKIYDYVKEDFQRLWSKKESELNKCGEKYDLNFSRSGRSITNESKRNSLIEYAETKKLPKDDIWYDVQDIGKDNIDQNLPLFEIYQNEVSLNTSSANFQRPFQEAISKAMESVTNLSSKIEENVNGSIEQLGKHIEEYLKEQTDTVEGIELIPKFDWKHLASIGVNIVDKLGYHIPAENRGSGLKRLLMVSYLRYAAEISREGEDHSVIYGIEEPETSLHPGAQRILLDSIKTLVESGVQVIYTTHSPVFVSEMSQEDIVIIKRNENSSVVIPGSTLSKESVMDEIVEELGISSRDAILNYDSCIFVEGKSDIWFFEEAWNKLYSDGKLTKSIEELRIGFVPFGGDNLKFYVERGLLKSLSRNFAVIIDCDRKSPEQQPSNSKLRFGTKCEDDGGKFMILKKREIENYVHPAAYKRVYKEDVVIDDFGDVKKYLFGGRNGPDKFRHVIQEMNADEFLEKDSYGTGKHELVEMFSELANLFDL